VGAGFKLAPTTLRYPDAAFLVIEAHQAMINGDFPKKPSINKLFSRRLTLPYSLATKLSTVKEPERCFSGII
jgi:hypothetical protein